MLAPVRTGILGGTFDPPHLAHLVAGESAYRQLGLDRVVFMPAGAPWQKAGRRVSDAGHRWEMTRLAVAGGSYAVASDDPTADPAEVAILDGLGATAVIAAGGTDPHGDGWLVEVFLDELSAYGQELAGVLRLLVLGALHPMADL